ncbi:MAG: thioesterase [Actinomycetota bacterium]|nr:thioesterase [Actinomycetota bacterium]
MKDATPNSDPFTSMVPFDGGRSYQASRRVRLGDVSSGGHIRLDAVARYLQDIAGDDVDDAGINGEAGWVVRRTSLEVRHRPGYEQDVVLVTWCSGTGAAWAERRTTVSLAGRPVIEASSVWVCMDPVSRRPKALDERFFAAYGRTPQSRTVQSRLQLPGDPPVEAVRRSWPLRDADFDVLGHVNNAIAWSAMEEQAQGGRIARAQVEYRRAIEAGCELGVVSDVHDGLIGAWLIDGSGVSVVSAVLQMTDPHQSAARTRPSRA